MDFMLHDNSTPMMVALWPLVNFVMLVEAACDQSNLHCSISQLSPPPAQSLLVSLAKRVAYVLDDVLDRARVRPSGHLVVEVVAVSNRVHFYRL